MDKIVIKNVLKVPFFPSDKRLNIAPGETRTIEVTADDIVFRGIELGHLVKAGEIDAVAPPKPAAKKYTEKELYAMSRGKQIEILKDLGAAKEIPLLEKGRVEKILELQ